MVTPHSGHDTPPFEEDPKEKERLKISKIGFDRKMDVIFSYGETLLLILSGGTGLSICP